MSPASCPQCGSTRVYKDGLRGLANGDTVQRWLCRDCGHRFSKAVRDRSSYSQHVSTLDTAAINPSSALLSNRQVGVLLTGASKNLAETTRQETAQREGTTKLADIKGKLVEYAFWMEKQNYSLETIRLNTIALKVLVARGAELLDTESVKKVISEQTWGENRRRNVINAYSLFLKLNGIQWEKPRCNVTQKFPFIPTEQELDTLIAGSGKKLATFLQVLKETAMRSGEAKRLRWTDIDFERKIIVLNAPEKGSNPRMWRISEELTAMLHNLPRERSLRVFGESSMDSMKTMLIHARKSLANKFQNPRLQRISFHTFRHWKATMEYHRTKDIFYVKNFLGHKSVKNTEIYINIENTLFEPSRDEFIVRVTENPDEIQALLEVGFEYVCQKDCLIFLRKRK